jgi:hypothetical protein
MTVVVRLVMLAIGAAGGVCTGIALVGTHPEHYPRLFAFPHVVPKSKDLVALRFAMVHDVLHERFPKHSSAYYEERNRLVRKKLEGHNPGDHADEGLIDDLAVGLEFAGDHDTAIQMMRDKLNRQHARDDPRSELYSSYANLGTFLILGPFRKTRPGNKEDVEVLMSGLVMIRTAIDIKRDSHFGREAWQAAIIEYMIRLHEKPETLLEVDMIGNKLDEVPDIKSPLFPSDSGRQLESAEWAADYLEKTKPWTDEDASSARRNITPIGFRKGGTPFDEPTLGIIGMWRMGGGAHPYFAVALGETMLRVNQRYLAWNAYERAGRMAESVWPDLDLQRRFREHCAKRQKRIEQDLDPDEVVRLRPAFEAELAFGQAFQKDYQKYEAEQIAAGKSIEDGKFYDAFWATHPPIATPVGKSDRFVGEVPANAEFGTWPRMTALFFAGLFVFAMGLAMRIRRRGS